MANDPLGRYKRSQSEEFLTWEEKVSEISWIIYYWESSNYSCLKDVPRRNPVVIRMSMRWRMLCPRGNTSGGKWDSDQEDHYARRQVIWIHLGIVAGETILSIVIGMKKIFSSEGQDILYFPRYNLGALVGHKSLSPAPYTFEKGDDDGLAAWLKPGSFQESPVPK